MRFPDSKAAKIITLFSETPFCHFSVEQCGTGLIHDSYPVASRSYVNITIEARSRSGSPSVTFSTFRPPRAIQIDYA